MSYALVPSPSLSLPASLDAEVAAELRALVAQIQGETTAVNRVIADLNLGWTVAPFVAANFTGNGAMTWTVTQANVTQAAYKVIGSIAWFAFFVSSTVVGGTPSSLLLYRLPNGMTVNGLSAAPLVAYDTGTAVTGAFVEASGTQLRFFKSISGTNWTAGSNTHLLAQIAFEVK